MIDFKNNETIDFECFERLEASQCLSGLMEESECVFVKKLSRNDRDWALTNNKHQNGVYILSSEREADFFPAMVEKARKSGGSTIYESYFEIQWPVLEISKKARLVHYTSKGSETHLTGLPKEPFFDANPASLLIIGRAKGCYSAIVVDSQSDDYETVHEVLSLSEDFCSNIFDMKQVAWESGQLKRSISDFVSDVVRAYHDGGFQNFHHGNLEMPNAFELAEKARSVFLARHNLENLDPYSMDKPGDALRIISRSIEYDIFKEYQLKIYSVKFISLILGNQNKKNAIEDFLQSIVLNFHKIDRLFLSASQQRKARAGSSFEYHIEAMLTDGSVPFEKQVVIKGGKRLDFVLPNQKVYECVDRSSYDALILSAKTTLRERWQQVKSEINNCELYLATVDERINRATIENMSQCGIKLVVPESLKLSDITEYKNQKTVISFKDFFDNDILSRKKLWVDTAG